MGTNYYWRSAELTCPTCGNATGTKDLHIGKSSIGWTFSFHSPNPDIVSFQDWVRYFYDHDGDIFDEYGHEVGVAGFILNVLWRGTARDGGSLSNIYHEEEGYADESRWLDPDGHSFCSREFS